MKPYNAPSGTVWFFYREEPFVLLEGHMTYPSEGSKLFRRTLYLASGKLNGFSEDSPINLQACRFS